MQIRRSRLADADLIDIYVYGAQNFGQLAAEAYFLDINQTFQFLAENPFAGRERTEFNPPVRIHPHGRHLIIYTIEDSCILIVRVLHQKMDVLHYL